MLSVPVEDGPSRCKSTNIPTNHNSKVLANQKDPFVDSGSSRRSAEKVNYLEITWQNIAC